MKKRYAALAVGFLTLANGCSDYLDVNTNPNAPQDVSANLYLPAMLHWMITSPQFVPHAGTITEFLSTSVNVSPRSNVAVWKDPATTRCPAVALCHFVGQICS